MGATFATPAASSPPSAARAYPVRVKVCLACGDEQGFRRATVSQSAHRTAGRQRQFSALVRCPGTHEAADRTPSSSTARYILSILCSALCSESALSAPKCKFFEHILSRATVQRATRYTRWTDRGFLAIGPCRSSCAELCHLLCRPSISRSKKQSAQLAWGRAAQR